MTNITNFYSEGKAIGNFRPKMRITKIRGGGQRVMIEIIISQNDGNDGRLLRNIIIQRPQEIQSNCSSHTVCSSWLIKGTLILKPIGP